MNKCAFSKAKRAKVKSYKELKGGCRGRGAGIVKNGLRLETMLTQLMPTIH